MAPLSLSVLAVAILAISHPVLANPAFGPVLARDDDKAPLEPLVFHDLTVEEFTAKVAEHRDGRTRRGLGTASDSALLGKRDPVLWEDANDTEQQAVVELRSADCVGRFGSDYRASSGRCDTPTRMEWFCRTLGTTNPVVVRRKMSGWCDKPGKACAEMPITNFLGNQVKLPYCVDKIPVNQKAEDGIQLVPVYEGHKTLPTEVWSPGTIDTYWQLANEYSGLTGQWDYRGHYASGKSFRSHSDVFAHSWSCIGCPSGTLYVETVGFKTEALGFSRLVSFT